MTNISPATRKQKAVSLLATSEAIDIYIVSASRTLYIKGIPKMFTVSHLLYSNNKICHNYILFAEI